MEYKVKQLMAMLEAEQRQDNDKKYGAHLTHWAGTAKPINIDERAILALIEHYEQTYGKLLESQRRNITAENMRLKQRRRALRRMMCDGQRSFAAGRSTVWRRGIGFVTQEND